MGLKHTSPGSRSIAGYDTIEVSGHHRSGHGGSASVRSPSDGPTTRG
ncbi:hypothetical protein [Herbiconiux liangxiaofengii]